MKLRSKILSYTLPLILIPLLVMALAVYYFIIRANQVQVQEERKRSLTEAIANIGQESKTVRKDVEVLANIPAISQFLQNVSEKSGEEPNDIYSRSQARTVLNLFFERNP